MPTSNTHTLTSDLGFPHPLYLYYTTSKGICQEVFQKNLKKFRWSDWWDNLTPLPNIFQPSTLTHPRRFTSSP